MERLTPNDAAILDLEDDVSAAHGLTLGIFEGPEPTFAELSELLAARVRLCPRYRQRVVPVPFGIERPIWNDDPNFSIDFHLRHTALPEREDRDALKAFVSRQLSQRLDRGKPLWELWFVSGLADGRWALASKVHYAIVDGVSGTELLGLLTDSVEANPHVGHRMPEPLPSDRQLLTHAVMDLAFDPIEMVRTVQSVASIPIRGIRAVAGVFFDSRDPDGLGRATGPHRRWQSATVSLDQLRKIRKRHKCSTTDLILASVAGAIRQYLVERGKPLPTEIEALVPVAIGAATADRDGQVMSLTARLPIAEPDPVARLEAIGRQTGVGAEKSGAIAAHLLRRQDEFIAPSILAQGVRSTMLTSRGRSVDTVAINVPGPESTISVLGRAMVEAYPVIPLPNRVQIAVAVLSLGDQVCFGITSDWDSTSGLRHAAAGIASSLDEL